MGLLKRDLDKELVLKRKFDVIATFKSEKSVDEQFIAIMEGKDLPIYIFTYGIEMV